MNGNEKLPLDGVALAAFYEGRRSLEPKIADAVYEQALAALSLAVRVAELEAANKALRDALGLFTDNAVRCCENELGEEYLRCGGCGGTDWGSDPDCFDPDNHAEGCKYKPESLRAAASAAIAAHPATSTPESV